MTQFQRIVGCLIDPFTHTAQSVTLEQGNLKDIYALLSEPDVQTVETFDILITKDCQTLYADDEGLYVDGDKQRYLEFDGQFIAGKVLLLGDTDEDGEATSTTIKPSMLTNSKRIKWVDQATGVDYAREILLQSQGFLPSVHLEDLWVNQLIQ